MWHWITTVTGINAPGSYWYNFWSGIAGDLVYVGVMITVYKKLNCTQSRCWRIGHHPVHGTHYKTCHKHATESYHAKIAQDHLEEFPQQHKFLSKE